MTGPAVADRYAGAAAGWASGAARVYGPLDAALVRRAPHPLRGRTVLDSGAGTGLGSEALAAVGARVVALDRSPAMLAFRKSQRPPALVGDVTALDVLGPDRRAAVRAAAVARVAPIMRPYRPVVVFLAAQVP